VARLDVLCKDDDMTTVASSHIWIDDSGKARVSSGHKVRMIVIDYVFNQWSPKTIHENYPDLSLAEIHAALAYYYDHKSEIDQEIEAGNKVAEELRSQAENPQDRFNHVQSRTKI
jgi:uncharacterized protein (DUF433 family)